MIQVGIVPSDLDRSLAFYRDVIGLAYRGALPVMAGRSLHQFDVDGAVLKLFGPGPEDTAPDAGPGGPFPGVTGLRWLTLDLDDLDAVAARAEAAGAAWQMRPRELRPGLRVAIVEDPDGVAVELVERRAV